LTQVAAELLGNFAPVVRSPGTLGASAAAFGGRRCARSALSPVGTAHRWLPGPLCPDVRVTASLRRRCAIGAIDRLVLWNVDLTLLDVGRVARDACAEAFRRVTGHPLVSLPQLAGRSDSEIFLEALALNDVPFAENETAERELLARYFWELEGAFSARQDQILQTGRLLPGARAAVTAAAALPGVVQSVLSGAIRPDTVYKLRAFGLDRLMDLEIGGYGDDAYPRGSLLMMSRSKASEKYRTTIGADSAVYVADTRRDVEAARVGGAQCIAVATGRDTVAELREAGADAVLADLSDTDQVIMAIDRLTRVPAGR
jgi:phosphoglycolate phosphatase